MLSATEGGASANAFIESLSFMKIHVFHSDGKGGGFSAKSLPREVSRRGLLKWAQAGLSDFAFIFGSIYIFVV